MSYPLLIDRVELALLLIVGLIGLIAGALIEQHLRLRRWKREEDKLLKRFKPERMWRR
jgi:hypothetical protein